MTREELEQELRQVEIRMEQVDKNSRAYRAGLIIRASILNDLAALDGEEVLNKFRN